MSAESSLECANNVLCQEINGELVLLDLDTECYFGLNETGAMVWTLLNEGLSVPALLDRLEEEFEAERDVLEADVQELIGQLRRAGLVRPTG